MVPPDDKMRFSYIQRIYVKRYSIMIDEVQCHFEERVTGDPVYFHDLNEDVRIIAEMVGRGIEQLKGYVQ